MDQSVDAGRSGSSGNGDEVKVIVRDGEGERAYVGIEVSRGPANLHLILSRPYNKAATTIDIPLSEVVSVEKLPHTPQRASARDGELEPAGESPSPDSH